MSDKEFARGLHVSRRDRAPDFVIANLGFNLKQFVEWAKEHRNERGYVNVDIKHSKTGTLYAELNTFVPGERQAPPAAPPTPDAGDDFDDDIPF